MPLTATIIRTFVERTARGKTYADLRRTLVWTGETIHGRYQTTSDTPSHRETASHIIGIEAWSQSRLRVPLGEPLLPGEYDTYRPAPGLDLPALAAAFHDTRAATVELTHQLESAAVPLDLIVPHNSLGDLTVGGWLSYIITHAGREARRF